MKTPTPAQLAAAAVTAILTQTAAGCGTDPAQTGATSDTSETSSSPSSTAGVEPDDISLPPWPAPGDVPARVAAAGLDLGPMGTAEHYHPTLAITIDGQPVPVPPNIGVDPDTGAMSAVHTHEADGTIHIEAHTVGEKFTLGQLFTQWGVALTPTQIGGAKANAGEEMRVTSNGAPVPGDPAELQLEPDQQIELLLP
ncbi:hypothetical protein [Nocardioides aquiterrae]|uniref:Uncharacterized protein n=1 Tax=Nocardioides aquiterrae TaxID=203799 RepID=A0ABN1UA03_9ACTN